MATTSAATTNKADAAASSIVVKETDSAAANPSLLYHQTLCECLTTFKQNGSSGDSRLVARVTRKFQRLRLGCVPEVLQQVTVAVIDRSSLPAAPVFREAIAHAFSHLCINHHVENTESNNSNTAPCSDQIAEGDSATAPPKVDGAPFESPNSECFLSLLALAALIDKTAYQAAVTFSSALVSMIKTLPRQSLDDLIYAKIYFYVARAFELNGNFIDIRHELLAAYRLAVVTRNRMKQATALVALLRNYLHYSQYDLAVKLVSKASLPDGLRSNSQSARYLYYTGFLKAIQEEYSDAYTCLMDAIGKAPLSLADAQSRQVTRAESGHSAPRMGRPSKEESRAKNLTAAPSKDGPKGPKKDTKTTTEGKEEEETKTASTVRSRLPQLPDPPSNRARGFRLASYKLAIVVELLIGGIPKRKIFNQRDLRLALTPYKHIVTAVRSGDLTSFSRVTTTHSQLFKADSTDFLIQRLHRNVIRTGVRGINLTYSQISLHDVAQKLGLESSEEAEGVVSKAIVDGVVDATLDAQNHVMLSMPTEPLYTTGAPADVLHKRIAFCMQLHNEAVEAMQHPETENSSLEKNNAAEVRRKEIKEQIERAEEEDDEDVDMI